MEQQIAFCTTEDGVRIAYATYGGDGAPLFVLPDIVGQEALWKHADGRSLLEALARGRRLITYDARFTGASERGGEHSSLDCWVRDITAVVDHLALDNVSLLSVGGISSALALLYAAGRPDRVPSMALWGTMYRKPRAPADMIDTFSRAWSWNARSVATLYFPSGPIETLKWFSRTIATAQFHATFGQIMAMDWDFSNLLPTISTPTLILQRQAIKSGDKLWSHEAARLLPNAKLVPLDGDADHPVHDHAQFMDVLLAFLDEHARADGPPASANASTSPLTERETEVLSLLAGGRTGREIAAALGISLSTAQRHIANIYAKIGARGRVDAAAYALARGLVTPRE
jgi:DNA-binding CsgD family transcriptional regulator/pimeloyl-ACP methyl ester carboxylesterase